MLKAYLKGVGMMVGLIFGAGIFALPYAIFRAGFFWGFFHFVIALLILFLLHFLYAEIAYNIEGRHRFTGYVKKLLGKRVEIFAFWVTALSYYGALLVYGVLGGLFLSNLFGGSAYIFSLIFFIVGSLLVCLKLDKIAMINFYLTIPLLGFVFYIFTASLPFIDVSHFNFGNFDFKNLAWFLPYGVWIFSLGGFAAVPEVKDIFGKFSLRHFKSVIFISLFLSAIVYWLFVFSIVGVSGLQTSPDAFSGVPDFVGGGVLVVGALVGFLAVFTSFLVLGIDLRAIYFLDFKVSKFFSWFLVVVPPLLLFFLGFDDFTRMLGLIGSLGLGSIGVLIILMMKKWRGRLRFVEILVIIAILTVVGYEVFNILF